MEGDGRGVMRLADFVVMGAEDAGRAVSTVQIGGRDTHATLFVSEGRRFVSEECSICSMVVAGP